MFGTLRQLDSLVVDNLASPFSTKCVVLQSRLFPALASNMWEHPTVRALCAVHVRDMQLRTIIALLVDRNLSLLLRAIAATQQLLALITLLLFVIYLSPRAH